MRTLLSVALSLLVASPLLADDAAVIAHLRPWIAKEVAAKRIPALSIALVDDQKVVWADGFGFLDDARKTAAGAETVYRIGSVSKPITALLLMLYVEAGLVDLDAPIETVIPDFKPDNTTGKKITLRQALSHRTGLVREPPVGNYFDDTGKTLGDSVKSVNGTKLVYDPESKTSYSNIAPCLSAVAIERIENTPYETVIRKKLFEPLRMTSTDALVTPELKKRMPRAVVGTYYGKETPAPVFDLATTAAGNIVSTPLDQAKLLSFLFARKKDSLLRGETIDTMFDVQFSKDKAGFGLGWFVSEFEGTKRIGHGGAVYGFATEFAALPEKKLGVVVMSARDVSNGVTKRIADAALGALLADREKKPLPKLSNTEDVPADRARSLAGRYVSGENVLELEAHDGKLFVWPPKTGVRLEVRQRGKELVVDDILSFGAVVVDDKDAVQWDKKTYTKTVTPPPLPLPAKWAPLVGEYGPDHNPLFIVEKDGRLHALIEWLFLYPLTEKSENAFEFPDFGMYHGHPLNVIRDKASGKEGNVAAIEAANYRFERRKLPRAGETFTIDPVRPIAELRKAALAAEPPVENNALMKKADLVDLAKMDPGLKFDIRYAGTNNFLGTPFYTSARAFLQKPAAEALVRVNKRLEKEGFGLMIHDAYRPWHVTKMFYDATPPRFHHFVADPSKGSRHNRGCAVDLTLYDRRTGKAVDMVGGYDEFSDRSYPNYPGGTSLQRQRRDLLRRAMEEEGFTVFENEWWHFDYHDWRSYPIGNQRFDDVK